MPDAHIETVLITRLQRGDIDAFDNIYRIYNKALYKNAFRITRDSGIAEDIVQETFIILWQKRATIDANRTLGNWLFVVSFNKAISWQKKHLTEAKISEQIARQMQEAVVVPDNYDTQLALIEKAMNTLSPQKRRVFELCKLEGKTYEETAIELNISRHTVKEYLSGAMVSVKDYVKRHPGCKSTLPILLIKFLVQ